MTSDADSPVVLPAPAFYFPIRNGRYDTSPNLFRFNTAFGNGAADGRLLQIDRDFARYRANKIACRLERFPKYVAAADLDPDTAEAVARLLCVRAAVEYPDLFSLEMGQAGAGVLECRLTGERIVLDARMRLADEGNSYRDTLDALCCQIQEDIAVVRRDPDRGDWIAYLHLCAPSFWGAEEKVGKSFTAAHLPVPDFGKVSAAAHALMETIIHRGPFVRFTWGIALDNRLNQHPKPPPGILSAGDLRNSFDPTQSPVYFRVERQTLWGIPEVEAFLFTIRVYVYDISDVYADEQRRQTLRSALSSMSPEAEAYKGLQKIRSQIIAGLD
ncbi:MAG: DUF3445 domain-containing protein [Armatimonadaceae bacterium]